MERIRKLREVAHLKDENESKAIIDKELEWQQLQSFERLSKIEKEKRAYEQEV